MSGVALTSDRSTSRHGDLKRVRRFTSGGSLPYKLILPVLLLEIILVGVPIALGFFYSLYKVDYLQVTNFVGFGNYISILSQPAVWRSFLVTGIFSFTSLFLTFIIGFSLALYLERDSRLHVFGRVVVLIPYVISMLTGSLLLQWIFGQESGLVSYLMAPLGMSDINILANPNNAMAALVFNGVWHDSAFAMILLMAGLKSVPLQLYAAAKIDGAGALYRFWRITLPMMRIPILITVIRLLIHFVNELTFALALTNGGPEGATTVVGLELYNIGFVNFHFGQANALATIIFAFNMVLIVFLVAMFRDRKGQAI